MTKKKLSGQTITIIILVILLLVTIVFGGVYAYYSQRSTQVQGIIKMANLKIEMLAGEAGSSGSSILLNTSSVYVPGQNMDNTALTITNSSNTSIYLVVVYSVKAYKDGDSSKEITDYDLAHPVIDIADNFDASGKKKWEDFRFTGENNETDFRYLIITDPIVPPAEGESTTIDVIPENKLMLNKELGNNYQACTITLTFRAYCIGSESLQTEIAEELGSNPTTEDKCDYIMSRIYVAFSKQIGNDL